MIRKEINWEAIIDVLSYFHIFHKIINFFVTNILMKNII